MYDGMVQVRSYFPVSHFDRELARGRFMALSAQNQLDTSPAAYVRERGGTFEGREEALAVADGEPADCWLLWPNGADPAGFGRAIRLLLLPIRWNLLRAIADVVVIITREDERLTK